MKRNAQKSISSSSAHNICIDHSNICFQCFACGEIPLTFCLQASHYLAFPLKTSPATKSVVSGLYQGVFSIGSPNGRNNPVSNSQTGLFPPQPGQQHGHWHLLAHLNPAQPAAGHQEAAVTCSASHAAQRHSGRSEEPSSVLTGMSSS